MFTTGKIMVLCIIFCKMCCEKRGYVIACLSQVLYAFLHVLCPLFIYLSIYIFIAFFSQVRVGLNCFNSPLLLTASALVFSACVISWYCTQSLLIPNIALWWLQCILKYICIYRFDPHLKHPWKTKFDVARASCHWHCCFSSTHAEEMVFVGAPTCQHVVERRCAAWLYGWFTSKEPETEVHFIASCMCLCHIEYS